MIVLPEFPLAVATLEVQYSFEKHVILFPDTSSIGASVRLESTLSEEAGSMSVCQLSIPAALAMQARIWLTIGKVLISLYKTLAFLLCDWAWVYPLKYAVVCMLIIIVPQLHVRRVAFLYDEIILMIQ